MTKDDPESYAAMSVPHETEEEAAEALATFREMVKHARQSCRIQNVVVVAQARHQVPEQAEPADDVVTYTLGDSRRTGLLLAMAYGVARRSLIESRAAVDAALAELDEYAGARCAVRLRESPDFEFEGTTNDA